MKSYLQIFSMTDHAKAFDRHSGPYKGINADLQTSEWKDGLIRVSKLTQTAEGEINAQTINDCQVILSYRHSDTGELQGTSEMLIPIAALPWTQMPGIEVTRADLSGLDLKLWNQNISLHKGQLTRIHFMKTIVYLKYFGPAQEIDWTETPLSLGPSQLHAEEIDHDVTIAPPSGSGLQVKMGQEIKE